jgi:hypothetical protein
MKIEKDNMPEHGSEIYYDVVIKNKSFLGWSAPDVGLGRMRFTHPDHGEFRANRGLSDGWMKECWGDFIEFIQANEFAKEER